MNFFVETAALASALDSTGKLVAAIMTLVKETACAALIQVVGPLLFGITKVLDAVKDVATSVAGVAATIVSAIISLLNLVLMLVACIIDFVKPILLSAAPALVGSLCNTISGLTTGITQMVVTVLAGLQAIARLAVSEI